VGSPGEPRSFEDEFVLLNLDQSALLEQPLERFDQFIGFDAARNEFLAQRFEADGKETTRGSLLQLEKDGLSAHCEQRIVASIIG